jgi:hypothetical protein
MNTSNDNKVPTTVKIDSNLYDELKMLKIRHKFTLQSFIEKCIYLYTHQDSFKETINNFTLPELSISGSL